MCACWRNNSRRARRRHPADAGCGALHLSALLPACWLAAGLFCAGCATLASRSRYRVQIESTQPGANVCIRNRAGEVVATGMTPFAVRLSAKGGYLRPAIYTLSCRQEGYWPQERRIMAEADPWVLADILLPLSPLWILGVDGVSGAMWRLPGRLVMNLEPQATRQAPGVP